MSAEKIRAQPQTSPYTVSHLPRRPVEAHRYLSYDKHSQSVIRSAAQRSPANASKQRIGQEPCVSSAASSGSRPISYDKSTPRCRSICRAARLTVGKNSVSYRLRELGPTHTTTEVPRPTTPDDCMYSTLAPSEMGRVYLYFNFPAQPSRENQFSVHMTSQCNTI
jgi:hypothetical protein